MSAELVKINPIEWKDICMSLMDHHVLFYKLGEMGKPFLTDSIPTACVTFDKEGNYVNFLFNPDFWNASSLYQKLFVICHEILHIILNHGKRFLNTENPTRANMAMDIIVNHSLVDRFGFVRENIDCWEELCWVDTIFKDKKINGFAIPNDETAEYYLNIMNKLLPNDEALSDYRLIDDHEFLQDMDKQIFENLNRELTNQEKESIKKFYQQHSSNEIGTKTGGQIEFANDLKVKPKQKWENVIKKWTKKYTIHDEKDAEQWARKHRRFNTLSSDLFLPTAVEVEDLLFSLNKIEMRFYLDTSGSCWHLKDRFFSAAQSLPKNRFHVKLFCFDTVVHETSLESRQLKGGGGTSFSIIEKHIQSTLHQGKYPDCVWVMTDGWGDKVQPQKPSNWHWFIDTPNPSGVLNITKQYIPQDCHIHVLSEFI